MKKVIVAHPGKQHSFRLATALKKEDILFKYITTVYDKESSWMMRLTKKIINKDNLKRANNRKCEALNDKDVVQFCEILGLLTLVAIRIDKSRRLYTLLNNFVSKKFGKKVAKYAIKNKVDAVIMYDTNSNEAFKYLKKKAPHIKRIMDVSAANRIYMKNIYEEDMDRCNKFSHMLYSERRFLWNKKILNNLKSEINLTQFFIVPSKFVKESLEYSGINSKNIYICPYGANIKKQSNNVSLKNREDKKLNCIYIGNVTQMKGIYYLLEAIKHFDNDKVSLKLIGKYNNKNNLFSEYMDRCEFVGVVTHDKVAEYCEEADIMILPSLGEGFSLSILEALGCGLPVICTTNSGADDAIKNGYNGFIIPIGSIEEIVDKIQWFLDNKNDIKKMSNNALKSVENYTWERYEININNILKHILE